ncbi:hypothetical protein [Neisseria meningitidis]|uniref:hypothetical protein n=1 Tax=Neisseria meningitidis TaxID=487 RepID=UPI001F0CB0D1|nr:hypothetical protein [Neisseria meningitidis]MCL5864074.1 hypothetical protein [Neisseria meningitidis]
MRPLPEYDIRAGIDGKPCKLNDVAPVFPIEDFGIANGRCSACFPSAPPWNITMTMSAFCLVLVIRFLTLA